MQDIRGRFIAIVVVTLALGYVVAPIKDKPMPGFLKEAKIVQGIDLAGGAEMTYRLLYEPGKQYDRSKIGDQVVSVLQNRINTKGLKEPRITTQGEEYVVIQLAGVDRDGLNDYKRLIGEVGNLELKKVASKEHHERFNADGIVPDGHEKYPAPSGSERGTYPWIQQYMIVEKKPVITGEDIATADTEQDLRIRGAKGEMGWKVNFTLKDKGAKMFDDAAADLFNRSPKGMIAIIIDNQLKSAPVVQAEAFKGRGEITGGFDEKEAKDLAIVLRSGSLPVSIGHLRDGKPVEKIPEAENFVGPSLGQDAILRGLLASIATLIGVALFMIIYYRVGGLVAVVTLAMNMVYLMAIMAFFNATLTLPGIAGIALTVGMAVDANILIFERMREELEKGKTLTQAFEAGHDRAFVTIMDANLTTLLAAIVLYWFGSGAVRGFAVTLSIGIITTLVSVLFCGKTILEMLVTRGSIQKMTMMRVMANPNFPFVKYLRPAVIGSVIVIAVTMGVFLARGSKNFGIEFNGGSKVNFAFAAAKDIKDVRDRVHAVKDASGNAKYAGADIQSIAEPGATLADVAKLGPGSSKQFQLRDATQDLDQLRKDIQKLFENELSHIPFEEIRPPSPDIPTGPRHFESGPAGAGLWVYLQDDGKFNLDETRKKIVAGMAGILSRDSQDNAEVTVEQVVEGAPKGLVKLKVLISERDHLRPLDATTERREGGMDRLGLVRFTLKQMGAKGALTLSTDPFAGDGKIGATVATELKNSSIWAMIVSWVLMIGYIAVRFSSWRFGVAAVIALIHDALISIGVVAVLGAVVPKSWGLSFDMNMTFVAAILTIIGFSVNDTIVIFDRIRENLALMKKESFSEIINTSVNQTMSRTILTSLTVWITVIVLYVATMASGGGIAEFSLPLIIGVLAGTYSTVFIAAPIVLWWYGGQKPQIV